MNTFKKLLLALLATVTTIGLALSTTACETPTLPTPPQEETPLPDDGNSSPDDKNNNTPNPDDDDNETTIPPITHVHVWNDWTETVAPTCSSQGKRQRVCKLDSTHVETETLPIREHTEADWGDWTETVSPTCLSVGEQQRVCSLNPAHIESKVLPVRKHTEEIWNDWTETIAPTCSSQGERQRVCKLDSTHIETETLPIREHTEADWNEWIESRPSTCANSGERYRICKTNSDHFEREILPTTEHKEFDWFVIANATCTSEGLEEKKCTTCYTVFDRRPIPKTEHNFTDSVWKSKDNVTMTRSCNSCHKEFTKEMPNCDHYLTLDVSIDDYGAISSRGIYTCEYCAVTFDPCDVLTIRIENAQEEGFYSMTITSKIATVEYDHYGVIYLELPVVVAEGCDFSYQYSFRQKKNEIRDIFIGENISTVGKIDYYERAYNLTFGEDVKKIKTDCTCDLFSLLNIYFEGDLPELEADALWRRNSDVANESPKTLCPTIYYKEGAKGFEKYGYKLQGCGLRMIGEVLPEAPDWTMQQFAQKANEKSIEMATELFEKAAKTRPFLQFYPFCTLSEYREIKDLALSLTKDLTTDTQKAKAIFDWIVENITYATEAQYYSVEKVFETKKAVCAGYAGLMHDMLSAVKIPSFYMNGIAYFGTDCTVQDILNGEERSKYEGAGHGWLICYLDGEATICDPTWGNFATTPSRLAELNIATTGLNGISVVPDEIDPALYSNVLYLDGNDLYFLNQGYLNVTDGYGLTINYVFPFSYRFRIGNDGYDYGLGIIDPKSSYHEAFIDYCDQGYKYYIFFGSDFREYSYVKILEFLAFENLWYNDPFDMDLLEEFVFDDYGTIYHINEGNTLSIVGTISENDKLVIPETINGMKVTSIDDNALQGCYAKEIILPDSIEKIGAQAFLNCINLESIVLPKNLKHIEPGAFAYCFNLKSVTMYAGVEFIGYKDNKRLCIPSLLFEEISTEQLSVYYQGTEEDFEKIYFNDPYTNPENLTFDTEQYEHVKSYVTFKE